MRRLEGFLSNAKNFENFSKIQLEIGRVYLAQNRIADAIAKFSFVDTTYAKTDDAAKAYYDLGKIYETIQINYAKAGSSYSKAKLEYPASLITPDAAKKADAFVKYFVLYSDMRRCDSLIGAIKANRIKRDSLALAADTIHTIDSSSAFSQSAKALSVSKEISQKLQAERDSLARLDSLKRESNARLLATETHSIDTLRKTMVRAHSNLLEFFIWKSNVQDSALFWYQRVIDEGGETEYCLARIFTLAEIFKTAGAREKWSR